MQIYDDHIMFFFFSNKMFTSRLYVQVEKLFM